MAAELIDVRDGVALAQLGPLCIALWRESVTRERFDRQAAALARVVAAHRGNAGFLCIVEPESKPPNDELRRAAARMIDGHGSDLVFVAAVIEGSGFQASITRSVLTAMSLFLPRNKTKIGYFSSVMDAALWGCEQAALPPARTIAARIQELRAELAGGRQAERVEPGAGGFYGVRQLGAVRVREWADWRRSQSLARRICAATRKFVSSTLAHGPVGTWLSMRSGESVRTRSAAHLYMPNTDEMGIGGIYLV